MFNILEISTDIRERQMLRHPPERSLLYFVSEHLLMDIVDQTSFVIRFFRCPMKSALYGGFHV